MIFRKTWCSSERLGARQKAWCFWKVSFLRKTWFHMERLLLSPWHGFLILRIHSTKNERLDQLKDFFLFLILKDKQFLTIKTQQERVGKTIRVGLKSFWQILEDSTMKDTKFWWCWLLLLQEYNNWLFYTFSHMMFVLFSAEKSRGKRGWSNSCNAYSWA